MRTFLTIAVVALGLAACNQIAGIQKPNSGTTGSTGTTGGTGDDTTADDDTTGTEKTGSFSTDLVGEKCGNSCGTSKTCRVSEDSSWNCSAIGGKVENASCTATTDCGRNLECIEGVCLSYCTNIGQSCGADGKERTCVGDSDWGICLAVCEGTCDHTGFSCRENLTQGGPGGGVCFPDSAVTQ